MTLGASGTDWILFLGRLHPLVVHLPIGLLVAVLIAESLAVVQRPEKVSLLRRALLFVSASAAIVAAMVGWFLASEGGYAQDVLFWHRWGGIAFALLLSIGFVFSCTKLWGSFLLRAGVLCVALGLMTIVGHMGGSMTHGETYLARYAPSWLQGVLGGSGTSETGVVPLAEGGSGDAQIVLSMLQDQCIECHGPTKQKGKLRLDEPEGILSTLVAGDPGDSEILRRLTLPRGHEDLMPPESDPISDDVILAVMRWIRDGAVLGQIEVELEAKAAEAEQRVDQIQSIEEQTGAVITDIPINGELAYIVDLSVAPGAITSELISQLDPISGQISEINIAGKQISSLSDSVRFEALRSLNASRSSITTSQLEQLISASTRLESINLHSTSIDDRLLSVLQGQRQLREIVLFETRVSDQAVASLENELPLVEIMRGETLQPAFSGSSPRLILGADYSKNRIALLREVALSAPDVLWQHEIQDIHDLHLLENGNILFQTSWTQIVEVDPESGETVWSYDAATQNRAYDGERVEVHAFERYENGNTMIAESGPARIIEVNPDGQLVHEIPMRVNTPDPHHDTRLVRRTPVGTYLVAHEKDGFIREYDRSGVVVWEYDIPREWVDPESGAKRSGDGNQAFSAVRLRNGNTLIGTGNGHSVIEVSPEQEIVWGVSRDELDGVTLAWVTTVQELSNGNIVIGNCHAGEGQAQIVEINREKEVIWRYYSFDLFGNALSTSFVTEDPHGFAYTE